MKTLLSSLLLGAFLLGTPAVAHADPADDLFRDGSTLFEQGKVEEAYAKFSEAWKLKQSYDIAANLAVTERKLGKHKDAIAHLEYALKNFPPSLDSAVKTQIEASLEASRKEVGSVDVTCPSKTKLFLDGKDLAETPVGTIYLEPGTYELGAANAEKGGATITLQVSKGQKLAITLDLVPGKGPKLPDATPPGGGGPKKSAGLPLWPGLVVGGVGVAGLGAGLGLALAAGSAGSEADTLREALPSRDACLVDPPHGDCRTIVDDLETRDTLTKASIGAFVAGGVLAAAGGVLIGVSAAGGGEASDEKAPATPAITSFVPFFDDHGFGALVGGRF